VIEMQGVSKVFRTDAVETHALKSFNLRIEAHEFLAITGPSGSGKTTFLNVAGLLEEFTSGRYFLDGKDVSRLKDDERSRIRNEKIGFIFQSFNLIPDLNIYDNVEVPLHYRGFTGGERRKRVSAALERVGLAQRMKHIPAQLSGGQQQRAAIARALAGEPRVILADEPTGNLDTTMSGQIMDLLEEINSGGTTILMVTHNPELAMRAHRHIEIVDGELAASRAGNRAQRAADSALAAPPPPVTAAGAVGQRQ
jgi:putative ABC transport system ATP-binding protein